MKMIKDSDLLIVRNLTVNPDGVNILDGISFSVSRGECLCLTGPSGAGKTVLLKCLNRLIKPSAGEILLDGRDTGKMNPVELRKQICLVGQLPVLFAGTVKDNLACPFTFRANLDLPVPDYATLMENVGLSPKYLTKNASKLSGGEKQKVATARALGLKPAILLFDEPTAALDEASKLVIEDQIRRLNRDYGMTIIVVTHDMEEARRLSRRILSIEKGHLEEI